MALDLSGVRRVVEGMLDDQLEVWRDLGGRTDDVLDENTGELKAAGADGALVWAGSGAIVPLGQPAITVPLDSSVAVLPAATAYQALLPLDAPQILDDDVIVVRGSRFTQLVGRRFRVADANVGTFAVVRVVRLQVVD
ncbi:DUF6093 family protein [Streptomyces turgidiscabies]|uniref:Uncharacterized protein n=1 Tax=Streptomyces turgidiscabies TaxID=85558 RepID=A0ABU0RQ39_9ACTN|nr:DUF6093 family protein [Streptomyces turgidiscabies]MDQ0934106.1 hypothetical protein [Streptomyces turgidiscabies]